MSGVSPTTRRGRAPRPRPRRGPRRGVSIRERRAPGVRVADTKSSDVDVVTQADRDSEALIRGIVSSVGPTTRSWGRRPGRLWLLGRALDRRPDRRHRELPLRHPGVRRLHRRRGRGRRGRRRGAQRRDGCRVRRHGRRCAPRRRAARRARADAARATAGDHRLRLRRRQRAVQAAAVARLLPEVRDIRRLGACSLDLCHLAEGSADGYVEEGVNIWDYAAGALIAAQPAPAGSCTPEPAGPRRWSPRRRTGSRSFWTPSGRRVPRRSSPVRGRPATP